MNIIYKYQRMNLLIDQSLKKWNLSLTQPYKTGLESEVCTHL